MRNPEKKIRVPQRLKQRIEKYAPGVRLMVSQPTESYVRKNEMEYKSMDISRAGSIQEMLDLRSGQVFFQCRSTAMSEGIWSDSPAAGWSIELSKSPQTDAVFLARRPLQTYAKVVEKYNSVQARSAAYKRHPGSIQWNK